MSKRRPSRLTFARSSLQQAQQLATSAPVTAPLPTVTGEPPPAATGADRRPNGELVTPPQGGAPAVLAAGAAQEAVGQAQTLLDAIEHTDADLAAAVGQLGAACSAVDQELAAAQRALVGGRGRCRRHRPARAAGPDPGDPRAWPARRRARPTR